MSKYSAHNSKVFSIMLKQYADQQIKARLTAICREVGEIMVAGIDNAFSPAGFGNQNYPIHTENLHDATGVGVYVDGSLHSFIPTKRAKTSQRDGGWNEIWGNELLTQAINDSAAKYGKGIWIVLFSAVPYAAEVNAQGSPIERGQGFFENFKKYLLENIYTKLQPMKI